MKFETTHQLAEYLLARKERPVRHHYYHHEDFDDEGCDYVSEINLELVNGKVYISAGELLEDEL